MSTNRIDVFQVVYYGWNCPECGYYNELSEQPDDQEQLECESCEEAFEIGDIED